MLPTGRNLFAIDPRAVPTRTAWEIGRRAAEDVVARYAQDHGDWPRRIVLDLWGSASMRTGGEDIAQAFALIGARPKWDPASNRVNGFEILPLAMLGRPRVDVTIRVSGLFRDVFPAQIALFDAAAELSRRSTKAPEDNPLAGEAGRPHFRRRARRLWRGRGANTGERRLARRDELGRAYLAPTSHAYDGAGEGARTRALSATSSRAPTRSSMCRTWRARTCSIPTPSPSMKAASPPRRRCWARRRKSITSTPRDPNASPCVRCARRSRASCGPRVNPRWIAGQMRHGHRGAAEIAETLDNLFAYAALTDAVESRHFDLYFDATLGDDAVRASSSPPIRRPPRAWREVRRGAPTRFVGRAAQFEPAILSRCGGAA